MSKELPYFKFNVSEWLLGRISDENYRVQGIFLTACCFYWHQQCTLNRKKLNKKLGKTNAQLMIVFNFIVVENNEIIIDFLDEQYAELTALREKRSNAGKKGGQAKLKQTLSKAQAPIKHIDKDKEEDKDVDKIINVYTEAVHNCFNQCLILFPEKCRPDTEALKDKWLDTIDKLNRIDGHDLKIVYSVVKKTREDDFWKDNFLSMLKLRKKDKNQTMYFIIFSQKCKSKSTVTTKEVGQTNAFEDLKKS